MDVEGKRLPCWCKSLQKLQFRCFSKLVFLKISEYSRENLCWGLFLIKLQVWKPETLLKRDSSIVVFLWTLRNFKNTFFKRTPLVAVSRVLKYREPHQWKVWLPKNSIKKFVKKVLQESRFYRNLIGYFFCEPETNNTAGNSDLVQRIQYTLR